MAKTAKTKLVTIYVMDDNRGPDGKIYHAAGPAIKKSLESCALSPNDTWDFDIEELVRHLKSKGVK